MDSVSSSRWSPDRLITVGMQLNRLRLCLHDVREAQKEIAKDEQKLVRMIRILESVPKNAPYDKRMVEVKV